MRTSIRNAVISFTCLALTAQGPIAVAQAVSIAQTKIDPLPLSPLPAASPVDAPASPGTFAELVTRAETLEPIIERLRAAIDRTQFDPTALNSSLDFDPEALARFVTEEIRFEQYRGVLRGAAGTLMGRAGNALDQSILLGQLLEEAGMDWRIARGTLNSADAERLVSQMAIARDPLPPAGNIAEIRESLTKLYETLGYSSGDVAVLMRPDTETDRRIYESVTASDTNFIIDALDQVGVELGDPRAMSALLDEARDYHWIEYRADSFDDWKTVHPAFRIVDTPQISKRDSFVSPPDDLHHRVRMEVFIEQKFLGELVVKPVITREGTTADLLGKPITYSNFPNNFSPETAVDMQGMLRDSSVFVPSVDGIPEGHAFDLDGQAFSVGLLQLDQYGLTEVFQAQGRQAEGALGALENLGKTTEEDNYSDDIFSLTAQWMQYTVIAPGGEEKSYRRYLLDRIGVVNRNAGMAEITDNAELTESAMSLLATTVLTVMPTRLPPAYVLARTTDLLTNEIRLIKTAADADDIDDIPGSMIRDLMPPEDFLLASAFDAGHDLRQGSLSYRTDPTVVVYQQGPTERVDIVHHTRRYFDVSDGLRFDQVAAIEGGVWESYAERVPIRDGSRFVSTATSFRELQKGNPSILVLTPETAGLVAALDHSAQTKSDITEVLQNGSSVIVPDPTSSDELESRWWRVRADTGETLGMSTGGYGAVTGERIFLQLSLINASLNLGACIGGLSSPSSRGVACCFVVGAATFAVGYVVGLAAVAAGGPPGMGLVVGVGAGPTHAGIGSRCNSW